MIFKSTTTAFVSGMALTVLTLASVYVGTSVASTTANPISGLYGCTLRDDRWGITPNPNQQYDVSGLAWIFDASNKTISGVDLRFKFQSQSNRIERNAPVFYKNEPVKFSPTEINGIYKFDFSDDDGNIYVIPTNGGNTLLLSAASGNSFVAESGFCQKI